MLYLSPVGVTSICTTVSWKAVIMAITCVWCWTLLDVLSNISDCPRLQNRFLDACVLEDLEKLHDCGLIHGGSFFLSTPERKNIYLFCAYIAITTCNIVFEIDVAFELAKIPPCTIEHRLNVSGVEYPIVRSHPVPNGIDWNVSRADINRCLVILINLRHGTFLRFCLRSWFPFQIN